MKINTKVSQLPIFTAGGAIASKINPAQQLRRSVLSCLLWEDSFYEDGQSIADRIVENVRAVKPEVARDVAIEARTQFKLRHVPLLIARAMASLQTHRTAVRETLAEIIQRPDELAEFLAIYWKDGKCPLAASVKKGLADAFTKFNEYALAKYNRDNAIKLRDVLFLCHAKPNCIEQHDLWKRLIDGKQATPDTWEVALSSGAEKKDSWERLIAGNKLGGLAVLKNLRNMQGAGVSDTLIRQAISQADATRVLPLRFISAAKFAPNFEDVLEAKMFESVTQKIGGRTVLIIDVSGSMNSNVSSGSAIIRLEAASAIAMIAREMFTDLRVYCTGGNDHTRIHATAQIPARRGFAMRDSIQQAMQSLGGGGIFLKQVMDHTFEAEKGQADRVIVITDEQDCDLKCNPSTANAWGKVNYLINISCEQNGIAYNKFTHINGFSEAVLSYIATSETLASQGQG